MERSTRHPLLPLAHPVINSTNALGIKKYMCKLCPLMLCIIIIKKEKGFSCVCVFHKNRDAGQFLVQGVHLLMGRFSRGRMPVMNVARCKSSWSNGCGCYFCTVGCIPAMQNQRSLQAVTITPAHPPGKQVTVQEFIPAREKQGVA